MDLAFFLRAERLLSRDAVPEIDHEMLVAALVAHQSGSATAKAARGPREAGWQRPHGALAELLAGGPAWHDARRAQRGSFRLHACAAAGKEP